MNSSQEQLLRKSDSQLIIIVLIIRQTVQDIVVDWMLGVIQTQVNRCGKSQIIDDHAQFLVQEQEKFKLPQTIAFGKKYQAISIVGPQGTGKSTLLNELFATKFEIGDRLRRIGRTTKGIWYDIDINSKTIIFDVEGSDSMQAGQNGKTIERKNSLFALALSHILIVNVKMNQIGLYKGSLIQILQIILELNLKLFGSEQTKEIIYAIRDYESTQPKQVIQKNLFGFIQQSWSKMPKSHQKEHIKLSDIFKLKAFFIHHIKKRKQQAKLDVIQLRKYLTNAEANQKLYANNILMADFPKYIEKIWEVIKSNKDINIPEQKVLISNMRCNEIQKQAFKQYEQEFLQQLEKSERELNANFVSNLNEIITKMLKFYQQKTQGYLPQQIEKVRKQFLDDLQKKIKTSFSIQIKTINMECLKELKEQINKIINKKQIQSIKNLKPVFMAKFKDLIQKVCFNKSWMPQTLQIFQEDINHCLKQQKQRILTQSLRQFDKQIKKQIQNIVNKAFLDKKTFCSSFWETITAQNDQMQIKYKNLIVNLFKKLQFKEDAQNDGSSNKMIKEQWQKIKAHSNQQLRNAIRTRSYDLQNYIMRHFRLDFNYNDKQIPIQWNKLKTQQIKTRYEQCKQKYQKLIYNFNEYILGKEAILMKKSKKNIKIKSKVDQNNDNNELLSISDLQKISKLIQNKMGIQYQQAVKQNTDLSIGAIPNWVFIFFIIIILDDCKKFLFSNWLFSIIILLIVALLGLLFAFGGKVAILSILDKAKQLFIRFFASLTGRGTLFR